MGLDKEKLLASAGHTADVNDLAGLQQALLALTQHTWSTIFLTEESLRQAHEQSDLTLEQFLVQQANVPMVELIQHIIELKGVYGFYVANIFVEGGINHLIPISTAYGLQVLPLAFFDRRIYCLSSRDNAVDSLIAFTNEETRDEFHLIPLGTVEHLTSKVEELYNALARNDSSSLRLGEYLVQQGHIRQDQLDDCLARQKSKGGLLGEILLDSGVVSELVFYQSLAGLLELPYYTSGELLKVGEPDICRTLPLTFAKKNSILALRREGDTVWLATSDPQRQDRIDAAARALKAAKVQLGIASPSSLRAAMNSFYQEQASVMDLFMPVEDEADEERLDAVAIQAEMPRYLHYIMYEAVTRRASDIHLERYENEVLIKFRIDGHLLVVREMTFLNVRNVQSFINKIKIDAKLDIAEQRRPQDGVIRKYINDNVVDFRVAIAPTLWGENVVLRVLNQSAHMPTLSELGLPPTELRRFEHIITNPQGYILLTGPTGCGKTTTLYAILQELVKTDKKIITAEDPIEYAIHGIQQSQVNEAIGNTFDRYMRSFMRLDPDVILVGEIRDVDTAMMATKAAMTGHLVLSTLHVNDSVSSVRRLADLQVELNLISQTLQAVVSQRLARRICPSCLHPYVPDQHLLHNAFPNGLPMKINFSHGSGCPHCNQTGYQGRLALVEFWQPNLEERALIDQGSDGFSLLQEAVAQGLKLLAEDALEKVAHGLTTIEEVIGTVPMNQIEAYLRLCVNRSGE